LGWLYPPGHVRSALGALFRHNFRPRLRDYRQAPRKFVHDDDAGMQMITWPKGPRPSGHILYADEVMSGFEYSAAAAMVQAGLLREGLAVVRAASLRYDGRLRTGLTGSDTASWGYSGNPFGDDECGKFYARPMSVWSMLLACQGFVYDGPAGAIGFRPAWKPEEHASFFSGAEGWGLFTQKRAGRTQTERLDVRYGKLRVRTLLFELPENAKPTKVSVAVGGRAIRLTHKLKDAALTISLPAEVTVGKGSAMTAEIRW
ncbi:MAG TPA: glucosylceramidase, partial [Polyangia bacterium]|nr:glucosylceramidase [Polyangia bacterium]